LKDLALAVALYAGAMVVFCLVMSRKNLSGDFIIVLVTYGAILFIPGILVSFVIVKVARAIGLGS
jgi:hypothetical protein